MSNNNHMSYSEDELKNIPWWKKTVVYQIYPRSFMDSNNDGIGDLKGIISKLDYVKDLGVETIWFSPFYKSPFADMGYDIAGYREICETLGDMDIVDQLIEEIHSRGMKIVLDMVMNHTSDQHPWFIESRSSKNNPKSDWYVWRDGKNPTSQKPGGKKAPNNWQAMITGSAWQYDKPREQYFLHQFLYFQPDLNYRCLEVQSEMLDTLRFWLRKGADGYRLDIINSLFEDAEFRDSPFSLHLVPTEKHEERLFRNPKYLLNHPDTLDFTKKLRNTINEFGNPERFMVGEVTASLPVLRKYVGDNQDGLNLVFMFQSLGTPMSAKKFEKLIQLYEQNFPYPYWPTWVFGNHDRFRRITRIGSSIEKAKLNTMLQLTARGTPFIYYGEEIGMENHKIPLKVTQDAVGVHFGWIPQFILNIVWKLVGETLNRDDCRTPMQWTGGENAGFSSPGVKTWLPLSPKFGERNVEMEDKDPDSLLNLYRRLLKLRKETDELSAGYLELVHVPMASKNLLTYKRFVNKNSSIKMYLNFGSESLIINNPSSPSKITKLLCSTKFNSGAVSKELINLAPWEGIIVKESD
jgi:glycosidase